jgi:2Fe-2S ferredoxin
VPKITYITADGIRHVADAYVGDTVMATAKRLDIDGIAAECGGSCSCATCHVYVGPDHASLVGPAGEEEDSMLELTASERRPTSRLSCQIVVTPEMDGIEVELPPEQL